MARNISNGPEQNTEPEAQSRVKNLQGTLQAIWNSSVAQNVLIGALGITAAIAAVGLLSGIEADNTHGLDKLVSDFEEQQTRITAAANECFYLSDEEQLNVSFKEMHGYRVLNTWAWFIGMSQEPSYHDLGTLPVYEKGECDVLKDDKKLALDQYAAAKQRDFEAFLANPQFRQAESVIQDQGYLLTEIAPQ